MTDSTSGIAAGSDQDLLAGSGAPGDREGRYRVIRELRAGATGAVHLAFDTTDGELVAIKTGSDPDALGREAAILAALDHPGVVRLKDWSAEATSPRLVLRFVNAPDLGMFLQRGGDALDDEGLCDLLTRLAEAVEAIHDAGFLHRDLKPANVLVRRDGTPVIVDFSAAAPLAQASELDRWSALSDGYAAPEQYLDDEAEGPWTDVYGLGAIGYRALSGRPPPPAPARQRGERTIPAAELADRRSELLYRAVEWALELEPAARPQSALEWKSALRTSPPPTAASQAPLDDYPPTRRVARVRRDRAAARTTPPSERPRRGRRLAGVFAALLVVGAGLAATAWYGWPLYERYIKTEWIVDAAGNGDAETIADALSRAGVGATIAIRPGTYAESLMVDQPVNLIAAVPGEAPLIAPEAGPCLVASASGGSVSGLRWRAPADIGEASPCLDVTGEVRITGNTVTAPAGPAVRVRDGADPVIEDNAIEEGTGPGVVIMAGARGTVARNTIVGMDGPGIVVRSGAQPRITENTIEQAGSVLFAEGAGGTFEGNRITASRGSAIEVTTGAEPQVIGNTIEDAGEAGVFIHDQGKGRFVNNRIVGSGLSGVVLATGAAPRLVGNAVRDSTEHGILVVRRGGGVLARNEVVGSGGHGIAVDRDTTVQLEDNRLDGNTEPQLLDARADRQE